MPAAVFHWPCGAKKKATMPASSASPAQGASMRSGDAMSSRCHFVSGPNGSNATSGAISSRNISAK